MDDEKGGETSWYKAMIIVQTVPKPMRIFDSDLMTVLEQTEMEE